MTDTELRTRIVTVLRQELPANSRDMRNLYGDLIASRGRNCADHFLTVHALATRGGSVDELDDAINVLIQSHPVNIEPPIVISLHGIFTTGAWQKRLAPIVTRAQMVPEPFDYGFFLPIWFLSGWMRAEGREIPEGLHRGPSP